MWDQLLETELRVLSGVCPRVCPRPSPVCAAVSSWGLGSRAVYYVFTGHRAGRLSCACLGAVHKDQELVVFGIRSWLSGIRSSLSLGSSVAEGEAVVSRQGASEMGGRCEAGEPGSCR